MKRDFFSPAALLLFISFSCSVAVLLGMLSIAESGRQQALSLIPLPGRDLYSVCKIHGEKELGSWPISEAQVQAIRRLPGVLVADARGHEALTMKYGRRHEPVVIYGDDGTFGATRDGIYSEPYLHSLRNYMSGRNFSDEEIASGAQVCVMDKPSTARLGITEAGVMVRIEGYPFKVIGIREDFVTIPHKTYQRLFGRDCSLSIVGEGERETLEAAILPSLQDIFQTNDEFVFKYGFKERRLQKYQESVHKMLTFALIGCIPVGIAFFGAFGIAITWARERKWSYALLRALGATRSQVAFAALKAPFFIAAASTLLGLALGFLLTFALQHYTGLEAAYNWHWFALAWAAGFTAMLPPALYIALCAAWVHPAQAMRT